MSGTSEKKLRVFVSYAREDAAFAQDLVVALDACRFAPFIDTEQMVGGVPFEERITALIADADSVVAVLSPASLASQWCTKEAELAEAHGKRLIPVMCTEAPAEAIPLRLRRLHYIAFCGPGRSFARALNELADALNTDVAWIQEHTRLGQLAAHWHERGRNSALLLPASEIEAAKEWVVRRPTEAPEPTLLQRELISESEKAERERQAREAAQAAAARDSEVARLTAEQEAVSARLEAEQLRTASRRRRGQAIFAAVVAVALVGAGFGWREIERQKQFVEQQSQIAEAQRMAAEQSKKIAEQQALLNAAQLGAIQRGGAPDRVSVAPEPVPAPAPAPAPGQPPKSDTILGGAPEPKEPAPSPPSRPTPDELARRVSAEALDLIILFDTGGQQFYERNGGRPVWYGLQGGVTIGIGYDLGSQSLQQFQSDWGGLLSGADMLRLAAAVGVKGPPAEALAQSLQDVSIPWETARTAFRTASLPRFAALLDRSLPNTTELPPDSYGALLSLIYNRGPSFSREGDRFTEMRAIKAAMERKDVAGIPAQLRAMARLWPDNPGLQKRREAEAALFEKGLTAAECDALWTKRNAIWHRNGYCFKTDRGIKAFGNVGCSRDEAATQAAMSPADRAEVKALLEAERLKGCK